MKNVFFLFFSLFLFACSSDNNKNANQIVGTWQLVGQFFGSIEGEADWTLVEDGYFYNFSEKNILVSNRFSCDGTYTFSVINIVLINFECAAIEERYSFSFENGFLILSPNPISCDEGCSFKFKKID